MLKIKNNAQHPMECMIFVRPETLAQVIASGILDINVDGRASGFI